MPTKVTVFAKDKSAELAWISALKEALAGHFEASFEPSSEQTELGQILCVDAELPQIEEVLGKLDRRARVVFLLTRDERTIPQVLENALVDDVLIAPFRTLDLAAKFARHQQFQVWEEVNKINASFSEILKALQDDLELAQRIQKAKLPTRFPAVKGFKIASRYLAGLKSGGDHFDLAESKDLSRLSIVLSDSSSYGLSSAVLGILVRVAMKLSSEETRSCHETVRRIYDELLLTLGDQDQLSLFYGIFSRKDLSLRFLNLGSSRAFYAPRGKSFYALESHASALTKKSGLKQIEDSQVSVEAGTRVAVISDGFLEAVGGAQEMCKILDQFKDQESVLTLNEFVFRVKSRFVDEDDLPSQDCTAVIFDVEDPRVVKLR